MEMVDVAIVGGGPAGSACAAFCARAGLRVIVVEREKFPREKVCGDCLNPACWPILGRLEVADRVRNFSHGKLDAVEFIALDGKKIRIDLPTGDTAEIALKRSLFDELLMTRARECGAEVRDATIVSAIEKTTWQSWKIDIVTERITARFLVAADGRNSTVARFRNLLPRPARERVALQTHIPLPEKFGNRIVLQLLPEGYSGQAPVNDAELNLCLVGRPDSISKLKEWAEENFGIRPQHVWRSVTPLTRAALPPAHENLFLIGDAARVVEPFTGEGIYYALRSGELAADAIAKIIRGVDRQIALSEFVRAHRTMYRGRLWINQLARAAVLSPRVASLFVRAARVRPSLLRLLIGKIVATAL
jgi:geranylgeranyl reductase family protein